MASSLQTKVHKTRIYYINESCWMWQGIAEFSFTEQYISRKPWIQQLCQHMPCWNCAHDRGSWCWHFGTETHTTLKPGAARVVVHTPYPNGKTNRSLDKSLLRGPLQTNSALTCWHSSIFHAFSSCSFGIQPLRGGKHRLVHNQAKNAKSSYPPLQACIVCTMLQANSVLRLRQYTPKPAKAGSGMSDPISFQFSARCIWSCSHPCLVCKCVTHLLWHCTILHQEKCKMPVCGTWLWQMKL